MYLIKCYWCNIIEVLPHGEPPVIVFITVVIFVWRLFRNRLPTKDNLFRRGILNNGSRMCASGCGSLETLNHLFLHCSIFGAVWYYIYCWLGISFHMLQRVTLFSSAMAVAALGCGNLFCI
jgi:hypothetical protein